MFNYSQEDKLQKKKEDTYNQEKKKIFIDKIDEYTLPKYIH